MRPMFRGLALSRRSVLRAFAGCAGTAILAPLVAACAQPPPQPSTSVSPRATATPVSAPPSTTAARPTTVSSQATVTPAPTSASATVKIKVFSQQGTGWDLKNNWWTKQAEQMFNIQFDWQLTTWDVAA